MQAECVDFRTMYHAVPDYGRHTITSQDVYHVARTRTDTLSNISS
jgi:hypothetical protein